MTILSTNKPRQRNIYTRTDTDSKGRVDKRRFRNEYIRLIEIARKHKDEKKFFVKLFFMGKRKSIILNKLSRQLRERENSEKEQVYIDDLVEEALRQGLIISTIKRSDYAFGEKASCCAIDLDNYKVIRFSKEEFARLFETEL